MAELSSGAVVRVVNPSAVVQVSTPGLVKSLWLKEGPPGPGGSDGNFVDRYRGAWSSATAYLTGDIVTSGGSSWLALANSTNVTPVEGASWTAVATKGTDGTNGRGISTVVRTSGTGTAGSTDTYTITYTDATTSTFTVVNGTNGTGTGDVVGPASSVDMRLAVFSGTTGKLLAQGNNTIGGVLSRTNHTGTQAASTITGLGTAATVNTGTTSGTIPLLGASGTLAVARLATGTPDGTKFVRDDGTLATPGGGGSTLLASAAKTAAAPASIATGSNTPVDVDPALAVTITAPASGAVLIVLSGVAAMSGTTGTAEWTLREGTTNLTGAEVGVCEGSSTVKTRVTARIKITGLTPGSSHTYKWAHRTSGASNANLHYGGIEYGSGANYGPATIEAWSA